MGAVGGFFASLELLTKEKSFKDGVKHLDNVSKSLKELASFALKAFSLTGGGLLALTAITSEYEAKNYMLAYSLHMSSNELMAFKNAAALSGASGDELSQSLLNLQHKSDRLKLGEIDVGLAKSLGMLGLGYQSFLKENPADKMKDVFSKAMQMTDKGEAGELIRDVLGEAGYKMWNYSQMTGQSLDSILNKSRALQFTNERTNRNAMMFSEEIKSTGMMFGSMGQLFFSTFGAQMIPVLQGLEKLILKNKALISMNIIKFAKDLGTAAKWLFGALEVGIPKVLNLIDKLGGIENVAKGLIGVFLAFKTIQTGASIVKACQGLADGIGLITKIPAIGVIGVIAGALLALTAAMNAFHDAYKLDPDQIKDIDIVSKSMGLLAESKYKKEHPKDLLGFGARNERSKIEYLSGAYADFSSKTEHPENAWKELKSSLSMYVPNAEKETNEQVLHDVSIIIKNETGQDIKAEVEKVNQQSDKRK